MNRATPAAPWEQQPNRWGQWSPEVDCEPIWSIHTLKHLRRSLLRQRFFSHSQSGVFAFMLGGREERRDGAEPIKEGKPRNPARTRGWGKSAAFGCKSLKKINCKKVELQGEKGQAGARLAIDSSHRQWISPKRLAAQQQHFGASTNEKSKRFPTQRSVRFDTMKDLLPFQTERLLFLEQRKSAFWNFIHLQSSQSADKIKSIRQEHAPFLPTAAQISN